MKRVFLTALYLISCIGLFAQTSAKSDQIQLVRSATLLIDYAGQKILLDPMLGPKGSLGSFSGKGVTPTTELCVPISEIVEGLDLVLVTHAHIDHFDNKAIEVLDKKLKVLGQKEDKHVFLYNHFWNCDAVIDSIEHNGITIIRTKAQHGTGRMLANMGEASGFILKASNHPTIYIIGDGVWEQGIYDNIQNYSPDYIVVNSGGAIVPGGYDATPIIMDERQVMALVQESRDIPVIAVHMDAVDHCRTTREVLRNEAKKFNISADKLIIPADGEIITLH